MVTTILGWIFFFILLGFVVSLFFRVMRTAAKFLVFGVILFVILRWLEIPIFPWWI